MKSLNDPFQLSAEIVDNSTLALAPFRILKRDIEDRVRLIEDMSATANVNDGADSALANAIHLASQMQDGRAGDVLANLVHTHAQIGQIIANMQRLYA